MQKLLICLTLFLVILFFPRVVSAKGEFASSYTVDYNIDDSGTTNVSEEITLKNLTDRFYASNFSLVIGSTKITQVEAVDDQGPLETKVIDEGTRSRINVVFRQQIAGKGKIYKWRLHFSSSDFTSHRGKTWQVSIPKVSSDE